MMVLWQQRYWAAQSSHMARQPLTLTHLPQKAGLGENRGAQQSQHLHNDVPKTILASKQNKGVQTPARSPPTRERCCHESNTAPGSTLECAVENKEKTYTCPPAPPRTILLPALESWPSTLLLHPVSAEAAGRMPYLTQLIFVINKSHMKRMGPGPPLKSAPARCLGGSH